MKAGRPKSFTYEFNLTQRQLGFIQQGLRTQGRVIIKGFGILKLSQITKRRAYNPMLKRVIDSPTKKKINLRATGDFYNWLQTIK